MPRIKLIAGLAILALALGALPPAFADDTEEPTGDRSNSPVALLLAMEFGISEDEVVALHDDLGIGFGAIFKLAAFAEALGTDVDTLLADAFDPETGEYEFAWGELKKTLTEEQAAALAGLAKNLGAIVSEGKRHHGRDEHQPDHAGSKNH